jgi:predicted dehydrogenase
MGKLKVGIIGSGNIFQSAHAQGWLSHPEVELVSICDPNYEMAKKTAEKIGIFRIYTDYREMFENEVLDAVDICTPNIYHSEIAIAALEQGINVFSEKPDAVNPIEAQNMADAAKLAGKVLMVMRNNRFTQASQFLKNCIDKGMMGELYTGRAGWIRRRGIPGRGGWFTTKALSGGGPLIDLGVHMIDLAIWLMGNPRPISVSGATYTKFAENTASSDSPHSRFGESLSGGVFDVEDLATGFIRFDNGATLQIEFSWASNIEEEMKFLELRGTKAGFSLKGDKLKLMTEIEQVLCDISPRFPEVSEKEGHYQNIHHFIDCVLGKEVPIFTPDSGVDMIKILSAIYESAQTGKEVNLLTENPVIETKTL